MASISIRYARAFADVVIELKLDPTQVRAEMRTLVDTVNANPDLRKVWESPAIPHEQKLAVLDALANRAGLVTAVRNFVAVLIDHGRIAMLGHIAQQFETELNNRLGFIDAEVTSVRELSPDERAPLERRIEQLTGKKVRAQYATDPAVLGGAIVKVGSTIYDGSVRGQLRRMKEQLVEA